MPSLFDHLTDEELNNHPTVLATAGFLAEAILTGQIQPQVAHMTEAPSTPPQHQPQRRATTPRRKGD